MKIYLLVVILCCAISCSDSEARIDSLIESTIRLDESLQKAIVSQHDRGNGFKYELKGELATLPPNEENKLRILKLKPMYRSMEKIDQACAYLISEIDNFKFEILKRAGEKCYRVKDQDPNTILWRKWDVQKSPCLPASLNLAAIQHKDENDIVRTLFVETDYSTPSKTGLQIWNDLIHFRAQLVKFVGTYRSGEQKYAIEPTNINTFQNTAELTRRVKKMITSSKANLKEDEQMLLEIYISLTKNERLSYQGVSNTHWICATFQDASLVGALVSLSALQHELLAARAMALAHIKSKFMGCDYGFTKVLPLVHGSPLAVTGEELQLTVFMGAFDESNQPTITVNYPDATISYPQNGTGIVTLKPKKGKQKITGTISIRNRSGLEKKENWEYTVQAVEK